MVPPDVAITAVMAAAHRLGYRCKPVDIDQVKAKIYQVGAPKWAEWTGFALYLIVFFAVLETTDHFVTALIAALLSILIIRPLMRKIAAITGDALS